MLLSAVDDTGAADSLFIGGVKMLLIAAEGAFMRGLMPEKFPAVVEPVRPAVSG
jgi:hypothetical protein